MFTSENNHPNDLNLFYYMNHICLIKDIDKYLFRNNRFEFEGKRKDTSFVIMRSFQYFCEYRRQK